MILHTLRIDCDGQNAQKSHGLCPKGIPDVANLPAGEVYFVPTSASGSFPFRFSDGTIAQMEVLDGAITKAILLSGDSELVNARNKQLSDDPATGIIGELGFGTQYFHSLERIYKTKRSLVLAMLLLVVAIILVEH